VPVQLLTFPHDDLAFRAHVEAARQRIGGWSESRIQAAIRDAYPEAVVRRASVLAGIEPVARWYAYRDGRILPRPADEAWWLEPDLPRTVIDAEGRYLDADESAAELFGVSRQEILAGHAGDFTRHEPDAEVGRRLLALLRDTGRMDSTAIVRRPDGSEWPIEFHIEPGPNPGTYATIMRRAMVTATA
jgi:PAS domain S-box-containing protein